MKDILEFLKINSPVVIALMVLGYFLKVYLDKALEGLGARVAGRMQEIATTSLDVKKDMRGEERGELVKFRVAVEKWEDFLQHALFDFTIKGPSQVDVPKLYDKDQKLFLDVKVGVVRACIYLREEKLEQDLMESVIKIRHLYYPLINQAMPRLIDLQAALSLIEFRMKQFEESGFKDMSLAPTAADREMSLQLQTAMTDEMKNFAETLTTNYRDIAAHLVELKESMNKYIYRRIRHSEIDKE